MASFENDIKGGPPVYLLILRAALFWNGSKSRSVMLDLFCYNCNLPVAQQTTMLHSA